VWLFAYPLLRSAPKSDEYSSPIRWVSDIIRIVGSFLPGFADTWINGFARSPGQFVVLLVLVAGLTWFGARLASRISDRMGAIWRGIPVAPPGLPNNWIYRLRSNRYYIALHEGLKRKWAPAFFAILFTKRFPEGMFKIVLVAMRWQARANAYSYWLVRKYHPFVWG